MDIPTHLPPDHPAYVLEAKLTALESALLQQDPLMSGHLKAVHAQLLKFEELVHLLKPEDIGKMMAAQKKYTGVVIVEAAAAKKAAAKKPKVGIDDIM